MKAAKAKEIFADAVDLPAPDRAAYVREACGDDSELLREVQSLMTHHDGATELFLSPPTQFSAAHLPAGSISSDQPTHIGHYDVIRKLGEGGMGVVYEARQENPRRTVALKLLRPGYVSTSLLKRFEHEAQVLGQLQHSGIAQIFEAGTADGQPFFAMEFVRGQSLTQYAEDRRLGTRQRLELMAHVCDAVHFAHARGVIHRDLKPGNLLVDETGSPKILDFGVARVTNSDTQTVTLRTDVGQLIGTLPYMSPEQVAGDPAQIDHRADVYALGVTLYELLVGRTPHDFRNRSIPEAARIIREEEPTRLSSINPKLRGDVETIVAMALEKEKQRRYASAAELAADIRRYLRDEPVRARPASTWYQFQKFSRRNRGWVIGLGAAATILVLAVIVSSGLAFDASRQRDLAQQRTAEVTRQAYRASIAAASAALRNNDIRVAQRHLTEAPKELRGWEWEYLRKTSDRSVFTFPETAGWVQFLDITADGSGMVTGDSDGNVRRWDLASGAMLSCCRVPQTCRMSHASMRFDGRRFLAPDDVSKDFALWDVETGHVLWRRPRGTRESGGFSPDGTLIVVPATSDDALEWLDAETGEPRGRMPCPGQVQWAHFGPSNSLLRVLEHGGCTVLYDLRSQRALNRICGWEVEFDREWTRYLLGVQHLGHWRLSSLPDDRVLAECPSPAEVWPAVHFFEAGKAILTVESSGAISTLDQGLETVTRFFGPPDSAVSKLTPDQRQLVTATRDGTIQVWDMHTTEAPLLIPARFGGASVSAAIAPDAAATLIGGWGDVQLYDARSGMLRWRKTLGRSFLSAVVLHPDGRRIAAIDTAGRTILLDADTGGALAEHAPLGAAAYAARWLRKDDQLVAGLRDGRIAILPAHDGSPPRYLTAHGNPVQCLAISDDETLMASGSGVGAENTNFRDDAPATTTDNSILVWNTTRWAVQRRLAGHARPVIAAAFHPDGVRLATAGLEGVILIWDARTGDQLGAIRNIGEARALAFHPGGQRLAAVSTDGVVRVWDCRTFEELLMLRTAATNCLAARFSADGYTLVGGGASAAVLALETGPAPAPQERFHLVWAQKALSARRYQLRNLCEDTAVKFEADESLPQAVRETAVAQVRVYGDHANYLNSEAVLEARGTNVSAPDLALARRMIEAALKILPDDAGYLATHGDVLCRLGLYEEALETLERSNARYEARGAPPRPDNWAFVAIANHHLGRRDEARAALARLRAATPAAAASRDADLDKLRQSVEALLGE